MKSLTAFSQVLIQELGERCHISTERDAKTVAARVEDEGISFLTITLPAQGKDFLKSLSLGRVDHTMFPGFSRHGGLPRFLGGFLDLVFDRKTGLLLDRPSIDAIRSLHQIYSGFAKVELDCAPHRVQAAIDGFFQCEKDVAEFDSLRTEAQLQDFKRVSRLLFSKMFNILDQKVYDGDILPKHGPGSTAERLTSNGKYDSLNWTSRLEEVFPFERHLFPNVGWYQSYPEVDILEPGDELPVRVVLVPKTLKTPRVIAIEPACMQYMQQGILEQYKAEIERDDILKSLISDKSQIPNQDLAREGSITGALATLDLSEASDRVSNQLVRQLFSDHAWLSRAVDATRSRNADVLGQGVIPLSKFASMGSALCFPVESMVFLTIVFIGIEKQLSRRLTLRDISMSRGRVRIYGDDIIVPTDMMDSVAAELEAYGLKVNGNKSFGTGKFRESCGGDFYDGHWVTPIRVRRVFATRLKHADELVSMVSLRNQLFEAGLYDSMAWIDKRVERILPYYPEVPRDSSALGRWTHLPIQGRRVHPDYHQPLIKACVAVPRPPLDSLEGRGALMKWFLKRSIEPMDKNHLQRAGRPVSVDIKTRWVPSVNWGQR